MTHIAYVALGSNLDDPAAQVNAGFAALGRLPQSKLLAQSTLYRSVPVGLNGERLDQPEYINAVAKIETQLPPKQLLDALLAVEKQHGRVRSSLHAPRTLDLDLLLYDDIMHHEHGLTLPHPRLHERAFVLLPLAELVEPAFQIPGRGTLSEWLARVDTSTIRHKSAA